MRLKLFANVALHAFFFGCILLHADDGYALGVESL